MESHTVGTEQVSHDTLDAICKLTLSGSTPEAISLALDLKVQTVIQFIERGDFGRKDIDHEGSQCKQDTNDHLQEVPTFIYSYEEDADQLHRMSLVTGEHSSHRVPSYTFKPYCCWSEVPGGSLLITGGRNEDNSSVREVVRIDTRREFAVSGHHPMLTPRRLHAAVYHTPYLYILGGWNDDSFLSECERYVCAEDRWDALPPLPRACSGTSGVVVESSLYALGGWYAESVLDFVQKLSLDSLTWELMQFRLPFAGYGIPCFKLRDTEVYLVVNQTLCSFTGFEVQPLKTLVDDIKSISGTSYYCRGTLYCSNWNGGVRSYEIGSLRNSRIKESAKC
jgi:hypothetical protein